MPIWRRLFFKPVSLGCFRTSAEVVDVEIDESRVPAAVPSIGESLSLLMLKSSCHRVKLRVVGMGPRNYDRHSS